VAVGYLISYPARPGRTDLPGPPALLQLGQMLTGREVRARDGRVLPPAGSDHLPIRARLRVV
jgi:endonuclease/exonuclease/phosphatase family metal-dependent hydrolase